jgi:small neutral amino acid transporter SnatA (MarC family)
MIPAATWSASFHLSVWIAVVVGTVSVLMLRISAAVTRWTGPRPMRLLQVTAGLSSQHLARQLRR